VQIRSESDDVFERDQRNRPLSWIRIQVLDGWLDDADMAAVALLVIFTILHFTGKKSKNQANADILDLLKIKASLKDGLLKISIPKSESVKTRVVRVEKDE